MDEDTSFVWNITPTAAPRFLSRTACCCWACRSRCCLACRSAVRAALTHSAGLLAGLVALASRFSAQDSLESTPAGIGTENTAGWIPSAGNRQAIPIVGEAAFSQPADRRGEFRAVLPSAGLRSGGRWRRCRYPGRRSASGRRGMPASRRGVIGEASATGTLAASAMRQKPLFQPLVRLRVPSGAMTSGKFGGRRLCIAAISATKPRGALTIDRDAAQSSHGARRPASETACPCRPSGLEPSASLIRGH